MWFFFVWNIENILLLKLWAEQIKAYLFDSFFFQQNIWLCDTGNVVDYYSAYEWCMSKHFF